VLRALERAGDVSVDEPANVRGCVGFTRVRDASCVGGLAMHAIGRVGLGDGRGYVTRGSAQAPNGVVSDVQSSMEELEHFSRRKCGEEARGVRTMDRGLESTCGRRRYLPDLGAGWLGAFQRCVPLCGYEGPLEEKFLAYEGEVEGRLVPTAGNNDAAGAVEDGINLGVLPELIH